MLSTEMQNLIVDFPAGAVATVNGDGTPSVSPKATFVILDDRTVAFGNIRSPGTLKNIRRNAAVEVCFTDILARKAVRLSGHASIVPKATADLDLKHAFSERWAASIDAMTSFVRIDVIAAELILSPAYDRGLTEAELRRANLQKLNAICGD